MSDQKALAAGAAVLAGAGLVLVLMRRRADDLEDIEVTAKRIDDPGGPLEEITVTASRLPGLVAGAVDAVVDAVASAFTWSLPAAGQRFAAFFDRASAKYRLPPNLIARVAYQESRFRDDIITGALKSAAGALGIMQIVPKWHPDVNPLDPPAAIDYAASYLRKLYGQFGSWKLALAAYNWGPGNVSKALQVGTPFDRWPLETRNYVTQISKDVGLA